MDIGQYVLIAVCDTGSRHVAQGSGKGLRPVLYDPDRKTVSEQVRYTASVKQSGGHVKIYSEVGEGTTIKVYLPRALVAAGRARPSEAPLVGSSGSETKVVVEDEEDVRWDYLVETLRT